MEQREDAQLHGKNVSEVEVDASHVPLSSMSVIVRPERKRKHCAPLGNLPKDAMVGCDDD